VIHKENSGTASARNVGIELAREYLWFVDGDDLVMKDSLFVLNDLLNCNKKHRFVILVE
jgi:glycosyltransferase involved in cell wall biosynthesis